MTHDKYWLEACWEVDELTPGSDPIAPFPRPWSIEDGIEALADRLGSLVCPNPRQYVTLIPSSGRHCSRCDSNQCRCASWERTPLIDLLDPIRYIGA